LVGAQSEGRRVSLIPMRGEGDVLGLGIVREVEKISIVPDAELIPGILEEIGLCLFNCPDRISEVADIPTAHRECGLIVSVLEPAG